MRVTSYGKPGRILSCVMGQLAMQRLTCVLVLTEEERNIAAVHLSVRDVDEIARVLFQLHFVSLAFPARSVAHAQLRQQ